MTSSSYGVLTFARVARMYDKRLEGLMKHPVLRHQTSSLVNMNISSLVCSCF